LISLNLLVTKMKIDILATGSSGNCYILTADNGRKLILDAGIRFKEITRQLDYDLLSIDGVLITHNHKDHSLSASDFEKSGIRVWKPYQDENKVQKAVFGEWKVRSFDLPHDNEPCVGYLIERNGFKLLYLTDLEYCKYNFKSLSVDAIIIETNYQDEYLQKDSGSYLHKVAGHMGLNACRDFIQANRTDKLKTVILCHMSFVTANPDECIEEIRKVVSDDCFVEVAQAGKEFEL